MTRAGFTPLDPRAAAGKPRGIVEANDEKPEPAIRTMPAEQDNKRKAPISYRPPEELRAEFERRVNASGLSTSAFITKAWSGSEPPRQSRRPTIDHRAVAKLLAALAGVSDQLRAAVSASGQGGESETRFKEAVSSLTEMRAACFKALGRKP